MTEGIIERVFDTYTGIAEYSNEFRDNIKDVDKLLWELRQKLIAEIENIKPVWEHRLAIEYIKQLLIGDSKPCKHEWKGVDNPFGNLQQCSKCGEYQK